VITIFYFIKYAPPCSDEAACRVARHSNKNSDESLENFGREIARLCCNGPVVNATMCLPESVACDG
jgi:hypothetical protein